MLITKSIFVLCACVAIFSACSKSVSPVTPTTSNDTTFLLHHALFEQNGKPSLGGWAFHPAAKDDTLDFEMDVPPGDGTWSYKLHTSDTPPITSTLTQNFTNLTSGVYSLTAWLKYKYLLAPGTFSPGWISIIKTSGGVSTSKIKLGIDSTVWHPETLLDTLSLIVTDTVSIQLSAGAGGSHGDPLWFDDVTFEKLP
jgi:hypothetical protein